MTESYVETKKRNGWKTGACWWISDAGRAAGYASACGNCDGKPASPGGG